VAALELQLALDVLGHRDGLHDVHKTVSTWPQQRQQNKAHRTVAEKQPAKAPMSASSSVVSV
jgi:hypothetical protein